MASKRENFTLALGGLVSISVFATILSTLLPRRGMIQGWNDALFLCSVIVFCAGTISALVSKSRKHYYIHLKDRFSGKKEDDSEFESEQAKRDVHAIRAIAIGTSGIIGILLSAAIALSSS